MRDPYSSASPIVIGIDGSRSAVQAALWAVDDAVDREIPLRLVYANESDNGDFGDRVAALAAAESAIHQTFTTIESTGKPVKIEAEIVHGRPITALTEASRSAAMLCVGSTGLKHAMQGRIGSTASALAAFAHCPVAIVPISAGPTPAGRVLAVVDGSPTSSTVLELAASEARLRQAPLRVLTITAAGNGVAAQLERRLAAWRHNNPDADIQSTAGHPDVVKYLESLHRNAEPVQLLVVDPGRADVFLGSPGRAALDAARCTLLISDRQCWL